MAASAAPRSVAQMVADHHQALYRYAFRLTGSAVDAEDLSQQVFMIAQQKLDQLRELDCARGWLFTILRNCYLKSCRQRLQLPIVSADFDLNAIPDETVRGNVLGEPGELHVDAEALQRAINDLDDEFKVVVLLFYFEHRSYREIAETLAIPSGTVMSRLSRAKAHLRRRVFEPSCEVTPKRDTVATRPHFAAARRSAAVDE